MKIFIAMVLILICVVFLTFCVAQIKTEIEDIKETLDMKIYEDEVLYIELERRVSALEEAINGGIK